MYLVRILPQSDFGLVAISVVLISLCSVISSSGLADYLIYYNGDDFDRVKIATFWLNITFGILVSIFIVIIAPYWGRLYNDVKLTYIIWLFIVPFLSEIFNNVPKAILKKKIEFVSMIKIQSVMVGIAIFLKFVFAFAGLGVYSLVLPTVLIDPIIAYLIFRKSGLSLGEIIHIKGITKYWRAIIKFSKFLVFERIMNRVVNEFDNLIIGKSISLAALAFYNQAFILANLMTTNVSGLFSQLLMPVFSKYNLDMDRLRSSFSKVISILSFMGSLILALMVITAPQIILLLLGSRFSPAIFPLQVLTFFAFFRLLNSPSGSIFSSIGKPQVGFYFVMCYTPIFLTVLFIAGRFGLDTFSVCVTCVRVLGSCTGIYLAIRFIKASKLELIRQILPFISAAIVAGVVGFIVNHFLFEPLRSAMLKENVTPFKSNVWWLTAASMAATCLSITITYIITLKIFFDKKWKTMVDYLSMTHRGVAKVLSFVR